MKRNVPNRLSTPTSLTPSSGNPIQRVFFLFWGAFFVAAGYGATFVLTRHFITLGGSEQDSGAVLGAGMLGTFVGVPLTGWYAASFGPARVSGIAASAIAMAYLFLASTSDLKIIGMLGGFALGFGWGAFYLAAPMALSRLVTDSDRAFWFTRFAAFQMAGIGVSPFLGELLLDRLGIKTTSFFVLISMGCLLASLLLFMFDKATRSLPHQSVAQGRPGMWFRKFDILFSGASRFPISMVALGASAFGGTMTFQSSIVEQSGHSAATFFAVYTVTVVAARWFLAGFFNRIPTQTSIPVLLSIMVVGLMLLFAVGPGTLGLTTHIVAASLFGVGYGLVYPLLQAQAVNGIIDVELREAALTWFIISYFLGIFGFPFLGGWIVVNLGVQALVAIIVLCGTLELGLALLRTITNPSMNE